MYSKRGDIGIRIRVGAPSKFQTCALVTTGNIDHLKKLTATLLYKKFSYHLRIHCRFHKSPPLPPILGQMNPAQSLPHYLKS